jgi:2-(1,2-epoxy-1,2-dihydrophenyl)acetyl-CoA isomerase
VSSEGDVLCDVDGPVARITINRPHARNAITTEVVAGVHQLLSGLAAREDVRVVEITGSGDRFFCPGADLDGRAAHPDDGSLPPVPAIDVSQLRVPVLLHEMPQVTVAAINGACAGAGLGWACACDIRLSVEGARFNTAFLDVGVAGDMGLPWSLPRIIGSAKARDLLFLRGKFDAEEALGVGLVSAVYPSGEFRSGVASVIDRLAGAPPSALRFMKANLIAAERMSFADFVDLESERHLRIVGGREFLEGARAFKQRGAR